MMEFYNRILSITTVLLTFSFIATAGAQTLISGGTTERGSTTTPTCEMPPSCEDLGYNKSSIVPMLDKTAFVPRDIQKLRRLFLIVPEVMLA